MKKRLVWIGMILLALCLAAYWIVPNWILAKPRETLIEQIRAQLQTDWQSEAVTFCFSFRVHTPTSRYSFCSILRYRNCISSPAAS